MENINKERQIDQLNAQMNRKTDELTIATKQIKEKDREIDELKRELTKVYQGQTFIFSMFTSYFAPIFI
jgi:chromosome segregation ATPase